MVDTEPYAVRLAALEQRQRRLTRQVRWLLLIAILLTALAGSQQLFNRSLVAQNEGLIGLIRLMQPSPEPAEPGDYLSLEVKWESVGTKGIVEK